MTRSVVSVCMITYNHELFIAQAIESVLVQKTEFPFEIVIGEDCSTDNTRKICEKFQKKYPKIIKLLDSDRNLGVNQNLIRTLKSCQGKYIATLEGDDYWTETRKLQMQFDYLETNRSIPLCFTDYDTIDEKGKILESKCLTENDYNMLSITDILSFKVPPVRTALFKKDAVPDFNLKIWDEINGMDTLLFSLITSDKTAMFIDKSTATWRLHSGGVYSMKNRILKYENILKDLEKYTVFFKTKKIHDLTSDLLIKYCIVIIKVAFKDKYYFKFLRYYIKLLMLDIKFNRTQWLKFNRSLLNKVF